MRIALVIGNSSYQHVSSLKNPANDARDVAAAFTRIGFSGISDSANSALTAGVSPLLDLSCAEMTRALSEFSAAAETAEQAVMYYAGHGIEVDGRNYLVPIDAKLSRKSDIGWQTASLDQLLMSLEASNGLRLLILDACRENPFRGIQAKSRKLARGLNSVDPPSRDILVVYAARDGTVALDGDGANSPFATAFLQNIERPGLEIRNFFGEIRDCVLELTEHQQMPYVYGTLGRKKEFFVPANDHSDVTTAYSSWMRIHTSGKSSDFMQFLSQHSLSPFAALAKQKLDEIENSIIQGRVTKITEERKTDRTSDQIKLSNSDEPEHKRSASSNSYKSIAAASGLFVALLFVGYFGPWKATPPSSGQIPRSSVSTPEPVQASRKEPPISSSSPSTQASQAPVLTPSASPAVRHVTSTIDLVGDWCRLDENKASSHARIRYSGRDGVSAENFYPVYGFTSVDRLDDRVTMADDPSNPYYLEDGGSVLRMRGERLNKNGEPLKDIVYHRGSCP